MNTNVIELGRSQITNFESASSLEWLVTNGIGGFACGTVSQTSTRRYHGLLVAALDPPGGRRVLVSGMSERIRYASCEYSLHCCEYQDGTINPHGYVYLQSFQLENQLPVWRYALADAIVEKRIWMEQGSNTTHVRYSVLSSSEPLTLTLAPFCTNRDYHCLLRGPQSFYAQAISKGMSIFASQDEPPYYVVSSNGSWDSIQEWHWNVLHRIEAFRGLDSVEDLFVPGSLTCSLKQGQSITLSFTTEAKLRTLPETSRQQQITSAASLLGALPKDAPQWISTLALAAQQFFVARSRSDGSVGTSVLAGYPWFMDWTRDTMISLPGLTLALGDTKRAVAVLDTYAEFVSRGMLPNRFLEHAEQMEFNSVDAALLFIAAVQSVDAHGQPSSVLKRFFPLIEDILNHYTQGSRHSIIVDDNDGLLFAGEDGVQLTWMDAKVGDWVVTPRIGKAVEINALWYNALCYAADLATRLKKQTTRSHFQTKAKVVQKSFSRFWNNEGRYLFDVIDGPDGIPDASIRPNQLFAVALPFSPLNARQQKCVVDCCATTLVTPIGLRSLASLDPHYISHYGGGQFERDSAYHQGTVWTWPLGYFVRAHLRVYKDSAKALEFLRGIPAHLREGALGSISEIFDAATPHAPRGCFAQAWSVAEILHAWTHCHNAQSPRGKKSSGAL